MPRQRTHTRSRLLKVAAHAALFLTAVVVFYLGLGVGLQLSPLWGYVLWGGATALALLNIVWIVRSAASAKQ